MTSEPTQFTPGALVRLRSGGPVMTVKDVAQRCGDIWPHPACGCRWFAADNLQHQDCFYTHELEAVQGSRWLDQPDGPGYWWLAHDVFDTCMVQVDKDMSVWWFGNEVEQMAHTITGHLWCKAADEPPARP